MIISAGENLKVCFVNQQKITGFVVVVASLRQGFSV